MGKRELNDREKLVLREIIGEYISSATPVGSRSISRKLEGRYSPATIRNVMSDLEELGLLYQPHTSAGRIPSEVGYRLFVDGLMAHVNLSIKERDLLDREISKIQSQDVRLVLDQMAQLLSQISNLLCVVMSPPLREGILHRLDLIGLGGDKILMVITIQSGFVRNLFLELNSAITRDEMEWLTAFLNQRLSGLHLSEIRSSIAERLRGAGIDKQQLVQTVVDHADDVFKIEDRDDYMIGGMQRLASQPEFYNVDELRKILTLLEDRSLFLHLFARAETEGLKVKIGRENAAKSLSSISVVTAPYKFGQLTGAIGLIGPTRMNYPKAVSIVEYATLKIDKTLSE